MKNCFILGFGRSGTSMMGGILYHSGYFMGENLYPSRESNPKGFFENDFINGINERILANYDYISIRKDLDPINYKSSPYNPLYGQRWLSYIAPETLITQIDDSISSDIQKAVAVPVFAYKDPRFNYTLPLWQKHMPGDVVYICMFRSPDVTAESVLRDCKTADYLSGFHINREIIFDLWNNSYQRVLKNLNREPGQKMIFVHYDQLMSKEILPELSSKLETGLDSDFISPELNRSRSTTLAPKHTIELYEKLCKLSGFHQRGV
ncbi:MAG: sulfotransferase [Bacteroidetes bacterium]|nr:sulfotransferase [Bacteroidota bacterium]